MKIIIVSADSDLTTTRKAIEYYSGLILHEDIVIISPSQSRLFEANFTSLYPKITLVRDEDIIDFHVAKKFIISRLTDMVRKNRSVGWYLQQFIKLSYTYQSTENVFLCDGDTIFNKTFIGQIMKDPFLMTTNEKVGQYTALNVLLGLPIHTNSFIANGAFVDTALIRQCIESPISFFKRGLDLVSSDEYCDFSEYQILGSICAAKYPVNRIRIFRRLDLLYSNEDWEKSHFPLEAAFDKYDAVCWEQGHSHNYTRRIGAKLFYFMNFTW